MKRIIVLAAVLVVVAAAAAAGWWYAGQHPQLLQLARQELDAAIQELGLQFEEEPPGLFASGFVEADEVHVTTELGGRIVAMHAAEGDAVSAGQTLVELDDALLQAEIGVAAADLGVAEATLAQTRAGVRQESLDRALAQLEQARAARQAAWVAWEDAKTLRENPQELDLAITAARARLATLGLRTEQVEALANSAQAGRDLADQAAGIIEDFEPFNVPVGDREFRVKLPADVKLQADQQQALATYQSWEAWTALDQANAAYQGAAQHLAELERQRANPLALEAAANAAESRYQVASTAVELAQAQVDGLLIGATPEQIAAVAAQVEVARAALDLLEVNAGKLVLEAPITGLVKEAPVKAGELAVPGAPLMTLADLDNLTLTVFVPENEIGQVQLGMPVSVTVDAYPGRAFPGAVTFVASEAEFTPKNVQTREERVNMVFGVKIDLPNDDHALKPGMPADAVILTEQ